MASVAASPNDVGQAKGVALRFGTSMAPPNNPWFLDLPIEWMPAWLDLLSGASIEDGDGQRVLRIAGGVSNWSADVMDELRPEVEPEAGSRDVPGPSVRPEEGIFTGGTPEWWTFLQHGLAKGAALLLGVQHRHDGEDLLLTGGWEAMLEGFGFASEGAQPLAVEDMATAVERHIADLRNAAALLEEERARYRALDGSVRRCALLRKPTPVSADWASPKPMRSAAKRQLRSRILDRPMPKPTTRRNGWKTITSWTDCSLWFVGLHTCGGNTALPFAWDAAWGVPRKPRRA